MSTVFDLTLDYRLQKPAAKMNPVSWIAQLQGMDYCCFRGLSFSNCVAVLALDFDTITSRARCFSDFLGVCSSLSPVSSNFSSVSTRHSIAPQSSSSIIWG
jgi:hypothetical protein